MSTETNIDTSTSATNQWHKIGIDETTPVDSVSSPGHAVVLIRRGLFVDFILKRLDISSWITTANRSE
jgi:hypothetical protein